MAITYLLLGSNMGDRHSNLNEALESISLNIGTIMKKSKIYETEPWGEKEQDPFLNQALEVFTDLEPRELLEKTQSIEEELKREKTAKWGPRTIDIDILFYDDEMISEIDLSIPHPFIHERRFTLIPLSEIAPEKYHPLMGMTVLDMLLEVQDESAVNEYKPTSTKP